MVLIFRTLIDAWRARLAYLDGLVAKGSALRFSELAERRVLGFVLRRHADGPHAEEPSHAAVLDEASSEASDSLFLSGEARKQLGMRPVAQEKPAHLMEGRKIDWRVMEAEDRLRQMDLIELRTAAEAKERERTSFMWVLSILLLWFVAAAIIGLILSGVI